MPGDEPDRRGENPAAYQHSGPHSDARRPDERLSCGWRSTGQNTWPGIITRPGGTAEHRFSNWIDRMSATDALGAGAAEDAGISGSGKYKLSILAVAQKVHGTCSQSLPPTVFQK